MTQTKAAEEFLMAMIADGLSPVTVRWYASILYTFFIWQNTGELPRQRPDYHDRGIERFNGGSLSTWAVTSCPGCGATDRQIKIGLNASGSQRLKCQRCKKKYTPRE